MKENLIHTRTCVYNINCHVVWSVKYRSKVLSAEIEAFLEEPTRHTRDIGEGDHTNRRHAYAVVT